MEEELSVTNTNVADEHLWALSFYKCHVCALQLSDLIWGLNRSLPGRGKGHGVNACLLDQGNITATLHPVEQLQQCLGFGEGLCWADWELHSCSLVPKLTAEENHGFPWVALAEGVRAQQVCDWQVSPQLLSAADGKCSSHSAVLSPGWLWQCCSCYSRWQGWDGGALGCCHSPVCPPCSWRVAEIWSETTQGKYPRAPPATMLRNRMEHLKEAADCRVSCHFWCICCVWRKEGRVPPAPVKNALAWP